jgi:altronate dehydratase
MCCAVASGGPWFNLFNLGGKSEAEMKKLKLNEIKNGRLAMLAVFGYGAQVRADGMTVLDTHTLDVGRDRTCVTGIQASWGPSTLFSNGNCSMAAYQCSRHVSLLLAAAALCTDSAGPVLCD